MLYLFTGKIIHYLMLTIVSFIPPADFYVKNYLRKREAGDADKLQKRE